MPSHAQVDNMPYSASDIFALIADVEKYPQFLPWCAGVRVTSRGPLPGGGPQDELLVADLIVAYQLIRETFTSKVSLRPGEGRIDVEYVKGPFRHLVNQWRCVAAANGGTDVHFFIDFEFKSRTLGLMFRPIFDKAFGHMSEAFEARAHVLYGEPGVTKKA